MIELNNITKAYKKDNSFEVNVLNGVDMEIGCVHRQIVMKQKKVNANITNKGFSINQQKYSVFV